MKLFKKHSRKLLLSGSLLSLLFLLSGCMTYNKSGHPNTTGISGLTYHLLVQPMSHFVTTLADAFNGNYGLAIIVITMIVRVIILPLGLYQSKKTMIQSEKMQAVKPQMDELQKRMKEAQTVDQQQAAQKAMTDFYRDNNISMLGGMGCLPLLIQMPIFSALFYAAKFTPGINSSVFFGVNLGERSLLFVVLAGLAYLLQSYLSMIGIPDEQKKTMRTMMLMSPLMIVFFSMTSPAGVTLYWIIGGIFSCIQTLLQNLWQKPRIRAEIKEELRKNPPKLPKAPQVKKQAPKSQTLYQSPYKKKNAANANRQGSGRNAGRKQNIHRN
ncbi:membrane protein insertase YidC [Enterococcus hirae]|jgi:YidC/Oxa1 family membrane protein insertase|nr:membrane protein insertase YidC [Enterococcaceae bacterium]MCI1919941.1 membrane protein insertase YidC [Enterococcaceae bacterium]MDM8214429.1 membrane protein insertase YidC [Enterococcus hirae]